MTNTQPKRLPFVEFIVLISLMTSITALSIDAMLPALPQIAADLGVQNANDRQLIVSLIFLGLSLGQLVFGPLSDSIGRKPTITIGFGVYIGGSLLSLLAPTFPIMLAGRLLQGIGVSAPRAVTLALVRDQYESERMARVLSFVMTVFILVPMIAPLMGQTILFFFGWRAIFGMFIVITLITLAWFILRMPESLSPENRIPFTFARIFNAVKEILTTRLTLGYTIMSGFISGAHLSYLNSAQQIFQEQYALGDRFPFFFAAVAFSIGLAAFFNARLVVRFGMRFLVRWALRALLILALVALGVGLATAGQPPLWALLTYFMLTFFTVGILFGNLNALAMQPLGHIAGIGAAIIGSLSTMISVLLGTTIGRAYNETILPLVIGFVVLAGLSIFVMWWAESGSMREESS